MTTKHGTDAYAAGGGGADFENQVGAAYLAAVLLARPPRGLEAGRADEVRFQRGPHGEPLDDLVVFAALPDERAKLSLQIRRDITYGQLNPKFNKLMAACWATFTAPDFKRGRDRFGFACGLYSKTAAKHYQTVLEYARASASAQDFLARIASGNQSKFRHKFVHLMRDRLAAAAQQPISDDDLWDFLRSMMILYFDIQQDGSSERANTIASLATFLPTEEQHQAEQLLNSLVCIAAQGNHTAGSFNRATLIRRLQSSGFRLADRRDTAPTADSGVAATSADRKAHQGPYRSAGAPRSPYHLAQTLAVMRERFFLLFEKHRVPATMIPTILSRFGVKASILEDDRALTDALSEACIAFLSDTFVVDQEWLRGSSSRVTPPPPRWYKAADGFCRSLAEACRTNAHVCVHFIRNSKPKSRLRSVLGDTSPDVGIIVEREHRPADGVAFSTYERWSEQEWGYWPCRIFYKALILFCVRAQAPLDLWYDGKDLTRDAFVGLTSGTLLPVVALSSGVCGHWHPDDYVCEGCVAGHHNEDLSQVNEVYAKYRLGSYLEALQRAR